MAEAEIVNACVKEFDPTEDYFPAKYVKPTIASYGNLDISGEKFVPHNVSILVTLWTQRLSATFLVLHVII